MVTILIRLLKKSFHFFGLDVGRYEVFKKLRAGHAAAHDLQLLVAVERCYRNSNLFVSFLGESKSQLRQDLFVLSHLNFITEGYFVEFGATNGVLKSNTYLLEKQFGWKGILAEPAKCWQPELRANRNSHIETNCVWSKSGDILNFNEVAQSELSTIERFSDKDYHAHEREMFISYPVQTISLNDLLIKYNAPFHINYLSLDTEGSEFEILSSLDFAKYTFDVITCEHNHSLNRNKIYSLLIKNGYRRIFEDLSEFDDWYVRSTIGKTSL